MYLADMPKFCGRRYTDEQSKAFLSGVSDIAKTAGIRLIMLCGDTTISLGDVQAETKYTCTLTSAILSKLINRDIPLEHLYTGYLAEWSRTPDVHNQEFINKLDAFGYAGFNNVV